jgi:hypothetical protein
MLHMWSEVGNSGTGLGCVTCWKLMKDKFLYAVEDFK